MSKILSVRGLNVSFGNNKVLVDINFDIEETGITHLMGPCGAGKSVLLQSLAGLSQRSSLYHATGQIYYKGEPISENDRPAILEQRPSRLLDTVFENIVSDLTERPQLTNSQQRALVLRLLESYHMQRLEQLLDQPLTRISLLERRMALILSQTANSPDLLLLDEPTSSIDDDQVNELLEAIGAIAQQRAVIMVQHNQRQALRMGGNAILLAGGMIQEADTTRNLLTSPRSMAGKEFRGTGTCAVPNPNSDPADLDEEYVDRYKPVATVETEEPQLIPFGPRGFHWIQRNQLAATPRPGLTADLVHDLKALRKVQIDHLVTLEESKTVPEDIAATEGISITHMPIDDMQPPTDKEQTLELMQEIQHRIEQGERVAVHCRGGLGRTGTILASYLVFSGMKPEQAINKVRCADQRMIQSSGQETFVKDFYGWLAARQAPTAESIGKTT